jgi:hypothetical protein
VPAAEVLHQPQRLDGIVLWCQRVRIVRHYLGERGYSRIPPFRQDGIDGIAAGEDADKPGSPLSPGRR